MDSQWMLLLSVLDMDIISIKNVHLIYIIMKIVYASVIVILG
jgi:hypothetical protein